MMQFKKYEAIKMNWSQNGMRQAIGWLGIFLPAVLLTGNMLFGKCYAIQDSISHYYFTVMGDVFVGILCAVSFFLLTYKGYDRRDNYSTSFAALFALGVAFFPTTNNSSNSCALEPLPSYSTSTIHFISATIFFLILAIISFFLFTKTDKEIKGTKKKRNHVYRICALIIVLCLIMISLVFKFNWVPQIRPVFWLEWIALIAFGISWLVKGEVMLKDREEEMVKMAQ